MNITQYKHDDTIRLVLAGRFVFDAHRVFRDSYEAALKVPGIKEIDIDLEKVEYLDSAALGMLLLLKERATQTGVQVRLLHCRGMVKDILEVASFGKIFTIMD